MYVPDKGDIVHLVFNLNAGIEIMKSRPAFVISRKAFNEHTGLVIIAPITSTIRGMKLEVVLNDQTKTKGAILVHQLKSLDFNDRNVELIEKASSAISAQVTAIASALIK